MTSAIRLARVGGLVLCGGQSSRMERPKAWLELGGETFLLRIARVLAEWTNPVVVVAAVNQALPPLPPEVEVWRDEYDTLGPLAALATGLSALRGRCEAVCISATDTPLIRGEFLAEMVRQRGNSDFALPVDADGPHPLAACCRPELGETARRLVESGVFRAGALFDRGNGIAVPVASLRQVDPQLDSLAQCNTPEEYTVLVRRFQTRAALG